MKLYLNYQQWKQEKIYKEVVCEWFYCEFKHNFTRSFCGGIDCFFAYYPDLFNAIGITYGENEDSLKFKLPNLNNKFIEGSSTVGTEKSAGLPNITGYFGGEGYKIWNFGGAFKQGGSVNTWSAGHAKGDTCYNIDIDASRSNSIYGNSTTVQPPALTMQYILKY